MGTLFQNQEGADRAKHHARRVGALPNRLERASQKVSAGIVEQQRLFAFAVVRSTHQRKLALPGGDARMRNTHRIDARCLSACGAARRPGHAVHNGNIAGEQIGKLCQEKSRPQIVHQLFI